jgi:hypothetical protein
MVSLYFSFGYKITQGCGVGAAVLTCCFNLALVAALCRPVLSILTRIDLTAYSIIADFIVR